MAIRMDVEGMDRISDMLKQLEDKAPAAAARGLYDGAGIMANGLNKFAEGIKTEPFRYATGGARRLPSPEEKDVVLKASAGIAKFKKNGSEVDTSVGYRNAGYAEINGREKPIPLIVNAINSGTSFMKKQPFVRRAVNAVKEKASGAIVKTIENELDQITKE